METKITKWGNSLGVRLPKRMLLQKALSNGAVLKVTSKGKQIILEPAQEKETLETLVAQITPENTHQETEWSEPVGKEIW